MAEKEDKHIVTFGKQIALLVKEEYNLTEEQLFQILKSESLEISNVNFEKKEDGNYIMSFDTSIKKEALKKFFICRCPSCKSEVQLQGTYDSNLVKKTTCNSCLFEASRFNFDFIRRLYE
jgi:hypothetical protein